ncbi:MAG: thioredoxin family protein [Anaerolineales bacterium]|nr:thioredoxin family protein [Anaerolineales bacterium]
MIEIRVFTHPTCATCPNAIQMVQRLTEQDSQTQMKLVSLATPNGREIAKSENVLSVPTIFVNETRFVGVPKWDDLLEAVRLEKKDL